MKYMLLLIVYRLDSYYCNSCFMTVSCFRGYLSTKNEIKSQKEIWRPTTISVVHLAGLVETVSVGLVKTCLTYAIFDNSFRN